MFPARAHERMHTDAKCSREVLRPVRTVHSRSATLYSPAIIVDVTSGRSTHINRCRWMDNRFVARFALSNGERRVLFMHGLRDTRKRPTKVQGYVPRIRRSKAFLHSHLTFISFEIVYNDIDRRRVVGCEEIAKNRVWNALLR